MGSTIIPPTPGWDDGPRPPPEERPSGWADMSDTEKAFFVYGWRQARGYAPDTGDPLADAGFELHRYTPDEETS